MADIRLLEKSVYELIAAGEVIDRPASVVKELVENAIDAEATNITVEIKNGGKTFMRVTDNGCGIVPGDVALAFMRHATSKIVDKYDLDHIITLGFRGEALASVCAVSKVDVLTKIAENDYGIHYVIDGGAEKVFEDCGCPTGTTVTVRDLFYNVPARLKFLKKDVTEGNSIAGVVSKLALSHPEISFKFIRDNKTELVTPGDGKLISAIYSVMGRDFHGSLIPVDYALNGVTVTGYVTKPLMSKANRAFQNFFVNSRYVKSVTCMVAVEEAYKNSIMIGKFPGCVLNIKIDPGCIDVNVHPTKMEIKFSDEKPVYDAVFFAVKNALMINDGPMEAGLVIPEPQKPKFTQDEVYAETGETMQQLSFASSPASHVDQQRQRILNHYFDSKFPPESLKAYSEQESKLKTRVEYKFIPDPDKLPKSKEKPKPTVEKPEITVIGEVFKTYIVAQRGDEIYFVDKHAAHERRNFNEIKSRQDAVDSQTLLTPLKVALSYQGHAAVGYETEILEKIGFTVKQLDPPFVSVTSVPILLNGEDPADLLTKVADKLAGDYKADMSDVYDELYHSVACKAAIKANSDSPVEELQCLAELAIESDDARYCPHGRPTAVKLTKYELEKLFKRVT